MLPNPDGPIDRDLDTLWFDDTSGRPLATLTVYGCHPTSLGGYLVGGDYPGFLCRAIEEETGAPALFSSGCAGDARPWYNPPDVSFARPEIAGIEAAGRSLADEVLGSKSDARGVEADRLIAADGFHLLPYGTLPTANELDRASKEGGSVGEWAEYVKTIVARGPLPTACPHEVQVLQLNPDFRLVFLGGEVLSEIGMRIKARLDPATTVTVAYSNGLIGYIPSKNAHPLGGYEVDGSHHFFRLPAPYTAEVEDRVVAKTHELVATLC